MPRTCRAAPGCAPLTAAPDRRRPTRGTLRPSEDLPAGQKDQELPDDGGGRWRYEPFDIPHPEGSGYVPLECPPLPGDLISLRDRAEDPERRGIFRVMERAWTHASWGSADFPYGQREPSSGPLLDIIVAPADGPYRDEAPMCRYSGCWARLLHGQWVPRPDYDDEDLEPHEHNEQSR